MTYYRNETWEKRKAAMACGVVPPEKPPAVRLDCINLDEQEHCGIEPFTGRVYRRCNIDGKLKNGCDSSTHCPPGCSSYAKDE